MNIFKKNSLANFFKRNMISSNMKIFKKNLVSLQGLVDYFKRNMISSKGYSLVNFNQEKFTRLYSLVNIFKKNMISVQPCELFEEKLCKFTIYDKFTRSQGYIQAIYSLVNFFKKNCVCSQGLVNLSREIWKVHKSYHFITENVHKAIIALQPCELIIFLQKMFTRLYNVPY